MPGTEAHGGYTFCGFASLVLLNRVDLCDVHALLVHRNYKYFIPNMRVYSYITNSLLPLNGLKHVFIVFPPNKRWVTRKQMKVEGGFQVRFKMRI